MKVVIVLLAIWMGIAFSYGESTEMHPAYSDKSVSVQPPYPVAGRFFAVTATNYAISLSRSTSDLELMEIPPPSIEDRWHHQQDAADVFSPEYRFFNGLSSSGLGTYEVTPHQPIHFASIIDRDTGKPWKLLVC